MAEDEGFLTRWSRRKRSDGAPPPTVRPLPTAGAADEAAPQDEAAAFDLASLPAIDDLTAESDISAFLNKAVPEALRRAALARVWTLDPLLQGPDTLAEYAWDFNDPHAMLGFGPLDPGIDAEAMLRQIRGEAALPDPGKASEAAITAGSPGETDPHASTAARNENDGRPVPVSSAESGSSGADSGLSELETVALPDVAVQREHPEIIEEMPEIPRNRRHGGALPN